MNVSDRLFGTWLIKADMDCQAAEVLLRSTDSLREIIAFHCQQAVEKYLKALLVCHQIEFERTHSIAQLLALIGNFDATLAGDSKDARTLTPYAVQIRYPNDIAEVLPGREMELLAITQRTRKLVRERLGT